MLLLESTFEQYSKHFNNYAWKLLNDYGLFKYHPDGVLTTGGGKSVSTYHTPQPIVNGYDHGPDYFAHSDDNGLHVYNPTSGNIETFDHHEKYHFDTLPENITNKIPPLPQKMVAVLNKHLIKNNSIDPNHKPYDYDGVKAVTHYTEYSGVNHHILSKLGAPGYSSDENLKHSSELAKHSEHLSEAIKRHGRPLTKPLNVYSGLSYDPVKTTKNGILETPTFTSTTINPKTSSGFGQNQFDDEHGAVHHIAHFKLPTGYKKGLYMNPFSEARNELEYLLDKNQKWKHEKTTKLSSRNKMNSGENHHVHIHTFTPIEE